MICYLYRTRKRVLRKLRKARHQAFVILPDNLSAPDIWGLAAPKPPLVFYLIHFIGGYFIQEPRRIAGVPDVYYNCVCK